MNEENAKPEIADRPEAAAVLARFDGPEALVAAARRVREEGYTRWDAHSPHPVHGIERAMGLRPTVLPWLVFGAGVAGMVAALGLQWWTNAVNYKLLISGKPYFSLPANIPVTFELIVLFSAGTAFLGALALNRLPEFAHPVFSSESVRRATTDGFFVSVESADPKFDEAQTADFLRSLGAEEVEVCRVSTKGRAFPRLLWPAAVIAVMLALVPPLLIARARGLRSPKPRIHIVQDMDFQPKYKAQNASRLFADGRAMRPPVAGTVARGGLEEDGRFFRGKEGKAWVATLPIAATMPAMRRGRERFDIFCATCHGLTGEGGAAGMTSKRAMARDDSKWAPPASLHEDRFRKMADGELFGVITAGVRAMPSYAAQIPVEDRWKIVLYVRALQRSQNAGADDVPKDVLRKLRVD